MVVTECSAMNLDGITSAAAAAALMGLAGVVPSRAGISDGIGVPHTVSPTYTHASSETGSVVTSVNLGGHMSSTGNPEKDSGGSDQNLVAIKDTCQYVVAIMENFNTGMGHLSPDARECIVELNTRLSQMLAVPSTKVVRPQSNLEGNSRNIFSASSAPLSYGQTPGKGGSSDDTDIDSPIDTSKFRSKVRFSSLKQELPSASSHTESRNFDHRNATPAPPLQSGLPAGALSLESVLLALSRLDNRIAPKPAAFDSNSGQSFESWLQEFEEFCQVTYRGSSARWIGEMGNLLHGDMHLAFDALRVPGDSYQSLTAKLVKWRKDTAEVLEAQTKSRFTKCQMQTGETLRLYAARLEKYFRLAYPQRDIEKSKTLRKKYCNTVPQSFAKVVHSARSMHLSLVNREITWNDILALAGQHDASGDMVRDTSEEVQLNYTGEKSMMAKPGQESVTPCQGGCSRYDVWQNSAIQQPRQASAQASSGTASPHPLRAGQAFAGGDGSSQGRTCYYCEKPGHIKKDCRRLLGLCLICGSDGHQIANCDKRRRMMDLSGRAGGGLTSPNNVTVQANYAASGPPMATPGEASGVSHQQQSSGLRIDLGASREPVGQPGAHETGAIPKRSYGQTEGYHYQDKSLNW